MNISILKFLENFTCVIYENGKVEVDDIIINIYNRQDNEPFYTTSYHEYMEDTSSVFNKIDELEIKDVILISNNDTGNTFINIITW